MGRQRLPRVSKSFQVEVLEQFYRIHHPKKMKDAESILRSHSHEELVQKLQKRYEAIPAQWRAERERADMESNYVEKPDNKTPEKTEEADQTTDIAQRMGEGVQYEQGAVSSESETDSDDKDSSAPSEPSAYEKQRLANIARNQQIMVDLGLAQSAADMQEEVTKNKRHVDSKPVDGVPKVKIESKTTTRQRLPRASKSCHVELLRAFYQVHHPNKADHAEEILGSHSRDELVEKLQKRYGTIPEPWKAGEASRVAGRSKRTSRLLASSGGKGAAGAAETLETTGRATEGAAKLSREKREASLREFYVVHNPAKVEFVERILGSHTMKVLVANLKERYSAIPRGWVDERARRNGSDGGIVGGKQGIRKAKNPNAKCRREDNEDEGGAEGQACEGQACACGSKSKGPCACMRNRADGLHDNETPPWKTDTQHAHESTAAEQQYDQEEKLRIERNMVLSHAVAAVKAREVVCRQGHRFWAKVAVEVGWSVGECQARWFEQVKTPPAKKKPKLRFGPAQGKENNDSGGAVTDFGSDDAMGNESGMQSAVKSGVKQSKASIGVKMKLAGANTVRRKQQLRNMYEQAEEGQMDDVCSTLEVFELSPSCEFEFDFNMEKKNAPRKIELEQRNVGQARTVGRQSKGALTAGRQCEGVLEDEVSGHHGNVLNRRRSQSSSDFGGGFGRGGPAQDEASGDEDGENGIVRIDRHDLDAYIMHFKQRKSKGMSYARMVQKQKRKGGRTALPGTGAYRKKQKHSITATQSGMRAVMTPGGTASISGYGSDGSRDFVGGEDDEDDHYFADDIRGAQGDWKGGEGADADGEEVARKWFGRFV
jgi:hypothetical protein